jgi:hypothetical protein
MLRKLTLLRANAPALLAAAGLGFATVAALDPARRTGRVAGPGLTLAAVLLAYRRGRPIGSLGLAAALAGALAVGASAEPQFLRADFPSYFCYLRSLAFDFDLDFANEWRHWGLHEMPVTPTGHRFVQGSIGPGLLWSPFFALAHVYVLFDRALGGGRYAVDGYSTPYLRSALVGTVVAVVVGSWLLAGALRRSAAPVVAGLAVVFAVATSPVLFYTFVHPGMAHGLTFGLAALLVAAGGRAEREPGVRAWIVIGLLLGLLVLVRLQAAVFGVFFLPFVLRGLVHRRTKPLWLVAAAAAALVGFAPQLVAWKAIYGRFWTIGGDLEAWARQSQVAVPVLFQPASYFDAASPYWRQVLFSADHGFFTWTPGMLLGIVGLAAGVRRFGAMAVGGLLVFVAAVWFNGSLADMSGADAFAARRFDLVVPFVAMGYVVVLAACRRFPLAAPVAVLIALTLWNAGFIRLWLGGAFQGAAPVERLARLQAKQLRQSAETLLTRAAGDTGRVFAYDFFVGEYSYFTVNPEGILDLGDPDSPWLAGGWSPAVNRTGPPQYRLALQPRSCVRFPLMVAVPLPTTITIKRPRRLAEQSLDIVFNERRVGRFSVGEDWQELALTLPEAAAREGQNLLCLEFAQAAASREGLEVAAHVRQIRVRSGRSTWPTPIWGSRRSVPQRR